MRRMVERVRKARITEWLSIRMPLSDFFGNGMRTRMQYDTSKAPSITAEIDTARGESLLP